jgi:hypothetical protein
MEKVPGTYARLKDTNKYTCTGKCICSNIPKDKPMMVFGDSSQNPAPPKWDQGGVI